METLEILQKNPTLENVPVEQLKWLIENSKIEIFPKGSYVFEQNNEVNNMLIVLSGEIELFRFINNGRKPFGVLKTNDITGLLPYSRLKVATGFSQVMSSLAEILLFPRDKMPEMISQQHELTERLVHFMTSRVRENTQSQIQNEKLMALGKLSAGLAHELNNPASAMARSAIALKEHLQLIPDNFKKVIQIRIPLEDIDVVNHLLFEKIGTKKNHNLSLLKRTELEDELVDWFDALDIANALDLSENMVDFNFQVSDLEQILDKTTREYFEPVINWVNDNLLTEKMVDEIYLASQRIATLINSIKSYSYMDRSLDWQEVDIHEAIKNTLVIMNYKIKEHKIKVIKNFDENLPKIKAMPGELNQIWTNIIDNAIDVLSQVENPTLEITTKGMSTTALVTIKDNGGGIPEDIITNIFEPFFTTKEVGKGTGLGLDIVLKIVQQHHADIKVKSQNGTTEFQICFPFEHD